MSLATSRTIISALHAAGVTHAFGLPGHQNTALFEALRTSPLRTVVPNHELGAAFMANGYNRASGKIALLATSPGPGFTYALTGLAEAWLDSAALIHLTVAPPCEPGNDYQLQAIDQATMASPVVKAVVKMGPDADVSALSRRAVELALDQEPGPVIVQTDCEATAEGPRGRTPAHAPQLDKIAQLVSKSNRIVLLLGQGAAGAASEVAELAETIGAAVVTTTSGRGVVPEDHRLSLGFEMSGLDAGPLNDLVAASDLVLAVGCKFSHNGSRGFRLTVPQEKLVQIDASAAVIGANYPVRLGAVVRCEDAIPALLERIEPSDGWGDSELDEWRKRGRAASWSPQPEPVFPGRRSAQRLITALRDVLSREAIVVTDSGRHQMLIRRWYRVLAARGLIVPTNLQSMGFAIPAAIGASLAAPDRPVVAVLGDGGLMMSGLELATAVKAGARLTAIVINDGAFGLIRESQLADFGTAPSSELAPPALGTFADALGIEYVCLDQSDPHSTLADALASPGVTLVEAPAREATSMKAVAAKGRLRGLVKGRLRGLVRRGQFYN
jgi:acetolactate synthase-1/2/3 large subunit